MRTGWTPEQISRLTLGQLHAYLGYWTGTLPKSKGDKKDTGMTDLEMFNIAAGIPKVVVPKERIRKPWKTQQTGLPEVE